VVVADVDDAAGRRALDTLGAASFVRTDVRVDGDVEHMVGFAEERHGGVDILVNNAGGWGPTANYPLASPLQWGATLDLNLRAPMLATQLVLEPMRRRGGGAVINVASTGGVGLAPYESPEYGAAKAGLIRFTACMAYARGETGVRVNCVVPDWIATERAHAELAAMTPAQRAAEAPLVEPSALAEAIVELIRDESLAGRVMLLPRGEPRRLLDAV
jgi:NAD(P)-dependent dehydrogenase (short-subunit alcohol dehydrogenase family)